jgi:dihydrodipicolinate synthase/N-acetylneuraminate lyase
MSFIQLSNVPLTIIHPITYRLFPCSHVPSLFLESNPIPTKKALEIMGKIGSGIRPPLCSLDETHHATITAALKAGNAL